MSLDVYLKLEGAVISPHQSHPTIFIREDGATREITSEEWHRRFPDREPIYVQVSHETAYVYQDNITHNLNTMADEAGIYKHLWRPDEIGITYARQLIDPLRDGLALLLSDPQRFEQYNPSNGWGGYYGLVEFTRNYLQACIAWPDAEVIVSR